MKLTKENYRIYENKPDLFNALDNYIDSVHRISVGKKGRKNVPVPCFLPPYMHTETYVETINRIANEVSLKNDTYLYTQMSLRNCHAFYQCGVVGLNTIAADGKIVQKVKIQRLEATNDKWKSQLILSFIMGVFTPPVIFILGKNENNDWELVPVDGQQRCIAFTRFINNDFPITGTGTCFDGLYFREFPRDLQNKLLDARFNCFVIDSTLNNKKFVQALFYKLNSTANNLNAMEIQNAMFPSVFSEQITKLIHDFSVSNKQKEYAMNRLLFPAGNPDRHYDRMNEKRLLIYSYAMSRNDLKVDGSTQESYITALLSATSDADVKTQKEGVTSINEIIRITSLMLNTFGSNFANKLFYKPVIAPNGNKIKELQFWKSESDKKDVYKFNPYTGKFCMRRTDDQVCRKNFVSVFFVSAALFRIYNTTRLTVNECNLIRGVAERIMLSDEYIKLLSGGPANLRRSKILLKAVLQELIDSNIISGRDESSIEQHIANCKVELEKLNKIDLINWRTIL